MVQQLLPKIGFAWTMRSLGFIQLGCLIICNIGIKPRVPPRKTGALVDWKSFKEMPYVLFASGMFFVSSLLSHSVPPVFRFEIFSKSAVASCQGADQTQNFWGVYFAFYYIASFGRSIIGLPYTESINLLITLNGVGVLGRIIPNFLADRCFGPLNSLIPVCLMTSILSFCWIGVDSRGGLYGT